MKRIIQARQPEGRWHACVCMKTECSTSLLEVLQVCRANLTNKGMHKTYLPNEANIFTNIKMNPCALKVKIERVAQFVEGDLKLILGRICHNFLSPNED